MFRSTATAAALLAIMATAAVASAQSIPGCTRNGTVLANDTCDVLSLRYSISTYQLAQANPSTIDAGCTNLEIGANVCLALQGMDCTNVYQVKNGDTCQRVADAFGLTLDTLYANNPNVDAVSCDNIYVGEVLCVAGTTYPYPAAAAVTVAATATSSSSSSSQAPASSDTMTVAASITASSSSAASSPSATSPSSGLEYCADDDTSEDCVDEDELPWCDEVQQ